MSLGLSSVGLSPLGLGVEESAGGGSASVTFTATLDDSVFSGMAVGSAPPSSTFTASTSDAAFSGTAVGNTTNGTITTQPLKNNTGTVLSSLLVEKIAAIKLSDLSVAATWTNQTTNGSGVFVLTSAGLVSGTNYLLVTSDSTGTASGVRKYAAT